MNESEILKLLAEFAAAIGVIIEDVKTVKNKLEKKDTPSIIYHEAEISTKTVILTIENYTKRTIVFENSYIKFSKDNVYDISNLKLKQFPTEPIENNRCGFIMIAFKEIENLINQHNIDLNKKVKFIIKIEGFDEIEFASKKKASHFIS